MFFRRFTGKSQSKENLKKTWLSSTFDSPEESLGYTHPADLSPPNPQERLPSLQRYSRDPTEPTASSSRTGISANPTLKPTLETQKQPVHVLPDIYEESNYSSCDSEEDEDFIPIKHKESDSQFPAFEFDRRTPPPVNDIDSEIVTTESFVDSECHKELESDDGEEEEKLPAEEDSPPPVPDKEPEPDPGPIPDYVEERRPRRPRNSSGFGSFLDNIVDLQAASKLTPIVTQPMEKPLPRVYLQHELPTTTNTTPPTISSPEVPQTSPQRGRNITSLEDIFPHININRSLAALPVRDTRNTQLPSPSLSSPPTPKNVLAVDPGTANWIAELALRRRLQLSGGLKHPQDQSETSKPTILTSPTHAPGAPSQALDEFGHRMDVNHNSSKRQREPPTIDSQNHHRHPDPNTLVERQHDKPNQPFPLTPDSITSPSPSVPSPTHAELEQEKQARFALQEVLDRTLAELNASKADKERLASQQKREKERLVEALRLQHEDNQKLTADNKSLQQSIFQLKSELTDTSVALKALKKEKEGWQAQLDAMRKQVISTDKRVRCLDNVTRLRFEARQNDLGTQIKRRGRMSNIAPAAELVAAVKTLNGEICQISSILLEQLEREPFDNPAVDLAHVQKKLGHQLTDMMESKKHHRISGANSLLFQIVLEVFIVNWCSSIIDAFYPATKTFSDLLIELSQKPPASSHTTRGSPTCGKYHSVVQTQRTDSLPVNFHEWVKDLTTDLTHILSAGGQRLRQTYHANLAAKFTALVRSAYNIRTALAEHDICGYLEIVVVPPSTPFQHKWMTEAYSDTRTSSNNHADLVLGTCGIGLQQSLPPTASSTSTKPTIVSVLKPHVVLSRVMAIVGSPSA